MRRIFCRRSCRTTFCRHLPEERGRGWGNQRIVAISGLTFDPKGNMGSAGAGKDTVANRLIEKHGFVKVGFADPMKRFVQDIFQFSDEQVWGESKFRNAPDERYFRRRSITGSESIRVAEDGRFIVETLAELAGRTATEEELRAGEEANFEKESRVYLTPRHALQTLGTDWGRACYQDVWVAYAMRVAWKLLDPTGPNMPQYDPVKGVYYVQGWDIHKVVQHVVFSDMRFKNEFEYIKNNGGKVVRVRRPVDEITTPSSHQSENDLNDVPDDAFDYVIHGQPNDVHDLALRTDEMMDWLKGRIRAGEHAALSTRVML